MKRLRLLVFVLVLQACSSLPVSSGFQAQWDGDLTSADQAKIEAILNAPATDAGITELRCNQNYEYTDGRGTYTVQHQCGSNKAPWSFRLSPQVQAIVAGDMTERGMQWSVNGDPRPRMAPHVVWASYRIHGTYTVSAGDDVSYLDEVTFRHNIGSGGTVTITIAGHHTFTDQP